MRLHGTEKMPGSPERYFVASLQMFTMADYMLVNTDTLSSLQIFQSQLHPNDLISGTGRSDSGSKESLSLYGIFYSLAGTPQGKAKLRQMFLCPLININIIRERHKTIAIFLQVANEDAFNIVSRVLRGVKDIKKALNQLQKGAETPTSSASVERGVWWTLTRFSLHVLQLKEVVLQLRGANDLTVVRQVNRNAAQSHGGFC